MVVILLILTFLTFIAVDIYLTKRKEALQAQGVLAVEADTAVAVAPERELAGAPALGLPQGLYYHSGHAWARAADEDLVEIGADELTGKVIGRLDHVRLPKVGEVLRQGRQAWTLSHGRRSLEQLSPVSGEVVEVNESVRKTPDVVNQSPYEDGWLVKVRLSNVAADLKNLFTGTFVQKWMDFSKALIWYKLSPTFAEVQFTYPDGGVLIDGIGDSLSDEEWETLKADLFSPRL